MFTPSGGKEHRMEVFTFKDRGGVGMSMYNTDEVKLAVCSTVYTQSVTDTHFVFFFCIF